MQATQQRPPSPQGKPSIHPVFVIAIGAAAVLAALLVLNLFRSPSREDAATASAASISHPGHALKLDEAQRARVQGAGWAAKSAPQEGAAIQAGSVQPDAGRAVRGSAADENSGTGAGSPGDAEQDRYWAATTGAPGGKGVVAQP